MNTVHVRGHDHGAQRSVPPLGDRYIAVMEERRDVEDGLEQNHFGKAHAGQYDHRHADDGRQNQFAGVKAEGRGRVHIGVRVMSAVKQPEEPDPVVGHVPEVHPDVKQDKHNRRFQIGRHLERLGKAELMERSPINGLDVRPASTSRVRMPLNMAVRTCG